MPYKYTPEGKPVNADIYNLEVKIERKIDRLDRLFINYDWMSQSEYDRRYQAIMEWSEQQYDNLRTGVIEAS